MASGAGCAKTRRPIERVEDFSTSMPMPFPSWPGLSRLPTLHRRRAGGRDRPGHDGRLGNRRRETIILPQTGWPGFSYTLLRRPRRDRPGSSLFERVWGLRPP
jgi:hypothetical protein